MKTCIHFIALIGLFLANLQSFAQSETEIKNSDVEGFYITLIDFKSGNLTIPTDKAHKGDKIKLKQFFISPDIISIEQDKESVYNKDSIFAIRLSGGENYRFIRKMPFLIADTSYLYIYIYKTTKTVYDLSGSRSRRKEIPVTYYYFSDKNQIKTYLLSVENLHHIAFPDSSLQNAVLSKFSKEEMLMQLNTQSGRFELNESILSLLNNQ